MISKEMIQGGYEIKNLVEVVEFLDHLRRPITKSDRIPGPYPYYGANGQQDSIAEYIFNEPLILLAEDGGLFDQPDRGIAYAIAGKAWVNNHAHVLRARDNVLQEYLVRVLENYDVTPWITGSTRAKLTKAGASKIQIPLPPLEEQKRIAGILDAADALRARRRESLAQLDTLLQSTFLEMFGDPVTNPMGWVAAELSSVCDFKGGGTPRKSEERFYKDGFIPWVSPKDMKSRYIYSSLVMITKDAVNESTASMIPVGSILVVVRSGILKKSLPIGISRVPLTINQDLKALIPSEKIENQFLAACLNALSFAILKKVRGTTADNIPVPFLKQLPIPLPPLELQHRFAAIVESVEQQKASQRAHLEELDTLFACLQQRAFAGELVA